MKKILIILILTLSFLYAKNIHYHNFPEKYRVKNLNTKKYYSYFLLKPADKINFTLNKTSEVRVYSRMINDKHKTYSYEFKLDGKTEVIKNTAVRSKVTVAPTRDFTSTISKVERKIVAEHENYIKNLNDFPIIVKIRARELKVAKSSGKYKKILPKQYSQKHTLVVKNKAFNYYSANDKDIILEFSGPTSLKIISRLVLNSSLKNRISYSYSIYKDGNEMKKVNERAYKSKVSYLENSQKTIPSTGDINILKFGEGKHKVVIKDQFKNRDLIFNFLLGEIK